MAFFCPQTGIRVIAPGNHVSVDPKGVREFDHGGAAIAAEGAANAVVAKGRMHASEVEPSMDVRRAAQDAATRAMAEHEASTPKPTTVEKSVEPEADKPKTGGGRRPKHSEAVEA